MNTAYGGNLLTAVLHAWKEEGTESQHDGGSQTDRAGGQARLDHNVKEYLNVEPNFE